MPNEKNINSRIQLKHDIEANWIKATGFIPRKGEIVIYDADEFYTYPRFKIGDGSGTVGSLPFMGWLTSDDEEAGEPIEDLDGNAIPKYEGTAIGTKCAKFSALMNNTNKVESFVFFTDPHLTEASGYENRMQEYLETIKNYYYGIPASFILCGGDWIGNSDTRETACFKLGYIDGLVRRQFNRFYHVVGNHDTNQQGKDETGEAWTGLLSKETISNLWFREEGKNYYSFDGANTKFYVLDSWKEGGDAAYYWEQIAWLAEKLKSDNADNVAIVLHIGLVKSGDNYVTDTLATNVLALCEAFNNSTTITLNGSSYDFTSCTGAVRFVLCGHIHDDYVLMKNGIPVIATTNTRAGNTATFDMCLVDYDTNTMNMVRVGSGAGRIISLTTGSVVETPDDDTGGDVVDITYGIGDKLAFLPQVNHEGGTNVTYGKTLRALIVSTESENGASAYGAVNGTNDVPYYPIAIPNGTRIISVICSELTPSIEFTTPSGVKSSASDWLSKGGGSYAVPTGATHFIVKFKKVDSFGAEETVPVNYDTSSIAVKLSSDPNDIYIPDDETDWAEDVGIVGDKYVFLPKVNHEGGANVTYDRAYRAIIVSTVSENGAGEYGATNGTNDVPYYPIAIPNGATSVTIVCPELTPAICFTTPSGVQSHDSGWLSKDGGSYNVPAGCHHFIFKFKKVDASGAETAFDANYDASGIYWDFA